MPENQQDKSSQHARVYAWLLIRANRDIHTHMRAHIRARDVVTWMQKGTGTNHIHKEINL